MRVYTNPTLRAVANYGKLLIGLAVLAVFVSQSVRILGDEPALKQLKQLLQTEQTQ
jgi:hypothetical protein